MLARVFRFSLYREFSEAQKQLDFFLPNSYTVEIVVKYALHFRWLCLTPPCAGMTTSGRRRSNCHNHTVCSASFNA
jgi:hypothetical protein